MWRVSTGSKIPLEQADLEAAAFARLIGSACARHEVAGSVRRRKSLVGDIEHVCIGRKVEATAAGVMFVDEVDALLVRLDDLVADGTIEKQIKSDGKTRWGERYRACLYRGVPHEVWMGTEHNWGCLLAIRTGPAELSEELVTRIKRRGVLRQHEGYLVYQKTGDRYPCETEEKFFAAAGMACVEPERRAAP
jgi:DNA polymerase/3'-5' exonuclease PolX